MPWDGNDPQQMRELIDRFDATASPDFRMRVLKQAQQRPQPGWTTLFNRLFTWSAVHRLAVVAALAILVWLLPADWLLINQPARRPQLMAQATSTDALAEAPLPAPAVAFTTGAPLTRLMQVGIHVWFDNWFSEEVKDTPWKQESAGPRGKRV